MGEATCVCRIISRCQGEFNQIGLVNVVGSFWGPFKRFSMKILSVLRLLNVAKYASITVKSKEKTGIPGVSEKSFSCIQIPASAP